MKKHLKKLLCAALSLAMVSGTIMLPTTAANADETNTWKFDFGSGEKVEAGWIAVTADDVYAANVDKSPVQYGFLGIDGHGDSYAQHIDGVVTKTGQNVTLKAGGAEDAATASEDYLGVDQEATLAKSKIDGAYPIRFAMKAESDQYYNVKVKLTTFDKTVGATASVFSERHHAIILEESMTAGEEKEVEFNTTVQPFFLKDGSITYNDDMLNVVVVGNNIAVESITIEKLTEQLPTVWMYNDSTGCDYQMTQPFSMLQDYGGTGSFLSKYLPKGYVAVNQGEGGLNAADNQHWNCANAHIGEGDYVYVQYGHNHKDDSSTAPGTLGYLESIPKYYEKAHDAGAYTVFVGPIDRHNDGQYNADTNTWSSTLGGFSKAAKYYTELLITAGKETADQFVTKAREDAPTDAKQNKKIHIADSTYEWADEIIAQGITENGVKDVAFVDLNQPTLDWLEEVCERVKTLRGSDKYERNATDYYFYSQRGTAVDGTHCNTAGADNTASFFFDEANKTIDLAENGEDDNTKAIAAVEAAVLRPLVTDMRTPADNAYVVPDDVITAGPAPNDKWPLVYVPSSLAELPLVIKDIKFDAEGKVESATIYRQEAEKKIKTYGILDIEIKGEDGETKGHIYSKQIEPDGANGSTFTYEAADFTKYDPADLTFNAETDIYTAVVRSASDSGDGIVIDEGEDADTYSPVYTPTDIDTELLQDDLNYYGAAVGEDLNGQHNWHWIGSGGASGAHLLGNESDIWYTEINASGTGSFYLWKDFDVTDPGMTNTGKYMFEATFSYTSGGGSEVSFVTGTNDKNRLGTARQMLFKIGANGAVTVGDTSTEAGKLNQNVWTDIRAIVDTDLGNLSVSVGGAEAVTVDLENYQTTELTVLPEKLTQIHFGGDRATYSYKVTNLHVAKLKSSKLPDATVTVASNNDAYGTVEIQKDGETVVYDTPVAPTGPDSDLVLSYKDGNAVVKLKEDGTAVLIEATYDGNKLASVKSTPLTLTANEEKTQAVTEGSKLMLWKALSGEGAMQPITEAIIAKETPVDLPASKSYTAELNTVVTAKAAAAEGYVFMGWMNDGKVVSMDAEYAFRMRDKTTLTANFVKEPGVEEVKSFELAADKTRIKAEAGTVNVSVTDAKDADGTPIATVKNTDAKWSCDDTNITVADGVVTIPAGYTSTDVKKTITVTAELNGIAKTISLIIYSAKSYEDFTDVETVANWITDTSTNPMSAIINTASDNTFPGMTALGNGKALVLGNDGNGDKSKLEYTKDLQLSEHKKLKFGFEVEPNQKRADGKSSAATLQFVDSADTPVIKISINTSNNGNGNSSFNDTVVNGFTFGTTVAVDTELDFTTKKMKYTLTDGSGKQLAAGEADLTATDLAKMSFSGNWNYGKFAIDNVYADWAE